MYEELDEFGLIMFRNKLNNNLSLTRSYRWEDRALIIDESQERLVLESKRFSEIDLDEWIPITKKEYETMV